jgi:hypothetical protein
MIIVIITKRGPAQGRELHAAFAATNTTTATATARVRGQLRVGADGVGSVGPKGSGRVIA